MTGTMGFHRLLVIVAAALSILRSIVLAQRKEYRWFPALFQFFAAGAGIAVSAVSRYLRGDLAPRIGKAGAPMEWYQDTLLGLGLAVMAVSASIAYAGVRQARRNDNLRHAPEDDQQPRES